MTERKDPLAALIEADRTHPQPDDATLQRAWAKVEHSVAAGTAAPVLDTAPLVASGHGGLLTLVTVGVLATVAVGGVAFGDQPRATTAEAGLVTKIPMPRVPPASVAVRPEPESLPEPAEPPGPLPAPSSSKPKRRSKPTPKTRDNEGSLVEEVQLMRRISRALSRDDLRSAKQLLGQHRAKFPNGSLEEERDAAAVRIACGLDAANADNKRKAFDRAWPQSIHAAAIKSSCD